MSFFQNSIKDKKHINKEKETRYNLFLFPMSFFPRLKLMDGSHFNLVYLFTKWDGI